MLAELEKVACQLVAVAGEGDVPGEGQVGAEREDEDEDDRDQRVAGSPPEAALGGALPGVALGQPAHLPSPCPFSWPEVLVPWLPGTLPITVWPAW